MSEDYRPFGEEPSRTQEQPPYLQPPPISPGLGQQPVQFAPVDSHLPPGGAHISSGKSSGGLACLYGCLIGGVVLILVGALVSVGGYFAVTKTVSTMIDTYTDDKPAAMPEVALPVEGDTALHNRVMAFADGLDAGTAVEPLILSADDINILLRTEEGWNEFGQFAYVTIAEDGTLGGEISLPLDQFTGGLFGTKGRFINGSATFSFTFTQDRFAVYVNSVTVKGQDVPEEVMASFRQENLAKDMMNNPDVRRWLGKIEAIRVEDMNVVIVPKGALAEEEVPAEQPEPVEQPEPAEQTGQAESAEQV